MPYLLLDDNIIKGDYSKQVEWFNDLLVSDGSEGKRVIKDGVSLIQKLNSFKKEGLSIVLNSGRSIEFQIEVLEKLRSACESAGLEFPLFSPIVIGAYDKKLSEVHSNAPEITYKDGVTIFSWGAPYENNLTSYRRALEFALNIGAQERGAHYAMGGDDLEQMEEEGYVVFPYVRDLLYYYIDNFKTYIQFSKQGSSDQTVKQGVSFESNEFEDDLDDKPITCDAPKVKVTNDDIRAFYNAEEKLKQFLSDNTSLKSPIFNSAELVLNAVYVEVEKMGQGDYLEETTADPEQLAILTEVLKTTYILLAKEYLEVDKNAYLDDYHSLLGLVNGQQNGRKIIAGTMIVFLSLIVLSLAVTAAIASFGSVPALMTITLLLGGAGAAAQGISISVATLAFFGVFAGGALAYRGREKGVAAATHQFYKAFKSSSDDEQIELQDDEISHQNQSFEQSYN